LGINWGTSGKDWNPRAQFIPWEEEEIDGLGFQLEIRGVLRRLILGGFKES